MEAFCSPSLPVKAVKRNFPSTFCSAAPNQKNTHQPAISRRALVVGLASLLVLPNLSKAQQETQQKTQQEDSDAPKQVMGVQTVSGLKYIDFNVGEGSTPKWGNFVNFDYVLYTITSDGKTLVKHDSTYDNGKDGYLVHHGNGEQIMGLEEALHTMRAGGRRRCIIPQQIAYFKSNLGPLPLSTRARRGLSKGLTNGDGTVVMDIEVNRIWEDPDDRGYYTDLVLTDEEIIEVWKQQKGVIIPDEPPKPNTLKQEYEP